MNELKLPLMQLVDICSPSRQGRLLQACKLLQVHHDTSEPSHHQDAFCCHLSHPWRMESYLPEKNYNCIILSTLSATKSTFN